MSFGEAAARSNSVRRIAGGASCPCGSGDPFDGCCGPLLSGAPAPTAERLMRSRYTAFTLGDAGHLERTWHPHTRPERIEIDPDLEWTGLEILDAEEGQSGESRGVVEFRASWREHADRGALHERSRFVHQREQWWYVDGVLS